MRCGTTACTSCTSCIARLKNNAQSRRPELHIYAVSREASPANFGVDFLFWGVDFFSKVATFCSWRDACSLRGDGFVYLCKTMNKYAEWNIQKTFLFVPSRLALLAPESHRDGTWGCTGLFCGCSFGAPPVLLWYTLGASRFRRNLLKVNFGARGATTFQCNPCEDEILLFTPKTGKFFVV